MYLVQLHIYLPMYLHIVFLFLNCFTDYALGFGGKYGIQNDRQDKSALGWQHIEKVPKHQSQIGQSHIPKLV